jgi:lipoprotein-releasing system permease protein
MFFLAIRQLLTKLSQTGIILLGVSLGTTTYVAMGGMMLGFQTEILEQLINNNAHIKVSAREDVVTRDTLRGVFYDEDHSVVDWLVPPSGIRSSTQIYNLQGWFERLGGDAQVLAYSPQYTLQVLINSGGVSTPASLIGVEPQRQMRVTNIDQYMLEGSFTDIGFSGNRIVIGKVLAERLGVGLGSSISLSTVAGEPRPFKIAGIFSTGVEPIDRGTVYSSLRDTQQLGNRPGHVSDIAVALVDVEQAGPLADQWSLFSRDKVQSWDQANANFLSVFKTQDFTRNAVSIAVLIVAGFGIYNVLSIMISQKKREIAILHSIGYTNRDVRNLFMIQGLFLGAAGALLGLGFGYGICLYLESLKTSFRPTGFVISYDPSIYAVGFLLAIGSCLFASYLPARAASRLTPIDIIRSEG